MGVAHVSVDGTWVDIMFPTSDLKHSTRWADDDYSGDFMAEVTLFCPRNYEAPFTLAGKAVELRSPGGGTLWGGVTTEPTRTDAGITLNFQGIGSRLAKYTARGFVPGLGYNGEDGYLPSFIPNEAVDNAIAEGAPFRRGGVDLGSDSVAVTDDAHMVTVWELLRREATKQGKRVHVDSEGYITYRADATAPMWTVLPDANYMGTADENFVTHIAGDFRLTPDVGDPGSGSTNKQFVYVAEDAEAAIQFGASQRGIDMSVLGLLTYADGKAYVDGKLLLVGGRMGWTEGVDLTSINLRHVGGAWVDPRWVKAGDMLQIPGVTDARSNPTTRSAIQFVLSEVRVTEADRPTAFAAPIGFAPRDFEGALAPPTTKEVT